ncbi:hypothetical protein EDC02_0106 [Micromonospora sp. Llam0]|nr:hypothetical protein EDC02_0106 [Micromonospora sp. Llam0]
MGCRPMIALPAGITSSGFRRARPAAAQRPVVGSGRSFDSGQRPAAIALAASTSGPGNGTKIDRR